MTPRRVAAVAVAVLLAACGGDDSPVIEGAPGVGVDAVASSVPDAGVVAPGSTAPAAAGGTGGPTATVAPTPAPGSPPGGAPGQPSAGFPALDGNVAVGAFAPAVLRPDQSRRVVVEVQAAAGAAPRRATLDHLRTTLAAATGKDVVLAAGASPRAAGNWTAASIRAAADAGARTAQGGGDAVLRLLFLPGTYSGDDDVLGVAVRGDTAAIFVEQTEAAGASLLGDVGRVESAVATHEVGHLLGLVDLHLATGRADPAHPGHSSNRESVMYYAVESGSALGLVFGPNPPTTFDGADLADLAAIAAGG